MVPWRRERMFLHRNQVRRSITICNAPPYSACSVLVRLYAAMGLHSYNLLHGENLELSRVLRYSKTAGPPAASSYCITLDVMEPSLGLVRTFETSVSEQSYGELSLRYNFARPHGETKKSYNVGDEIMRSSDASDEYFRLCCNCMPEMPRLNPFQNKKRFYLLKKSEVEENAWIRMYLDLAFATTNRGTSKEPDLSKLEIVEVAVSIEESNTSTSDTDEGLGLGLGFSRATNAVFYIRHMDWCKARVKKNDVDRVAIVRRIFIHRTGCFSLVGKIHSSQTLPKPKK
ncbi:unnamed protein product [Microthlaspi erraticum]|uniref:Uncharacterized protein n=1 Tax=Microthlaspi erraticum TaxID=1685480 RepID=A0A6D2I8P1_9BRAS|nr:unnamed protein product [Microthlaspi erraticum]